MQNLHFKLTSKYPQYNNWHQTKHHNKVHWGVFILFTLLIFGTILRWTPISFAADIVAPLTPTNLTATAVSPSQINLSWTASTDDVGVTGYKIYRCAGSGCVPTTQIATSATNSYSNTGLTASTSYTYAVSAYDAAGNESGKSASKSATTQAPPTSTNPIDSLKPGHWYEVPNSHLRDAGVLPNPLPPGPNIGPAGIMSAWSGGAFDTKRNRLLIWGGGHTAYAGNEIYAFDVNSLKWSRIWGPTPNEQIQDPDLAPEVYLDGNPSSRHTYHNLVYIPDPIDALWSQGGGPWSNAGWLTNATWQFDFGNLKWSRKSEPQDDKSTIASDYDPVTGRVLFYGKFTLFEYNPVNDSFKTLVPPRNSGWWNIGTGAFDYERRIFVAVGGGGLMMVNLTTGEHTLNPPTIGGDAIINAYAPGFVYDSTSKQFVGWSGDGTGDELASVYTLNPETWQWTKHSPAPTNNVIPTKRNENGTYGRFRYIPSKNAFILVNSIDQNVYIYKLNPGGGTPTPTDTISPTTPTNLTAATISSSQINLSWTASTDDVGVAGYKIYRCAGSACAPTVQIDTSAINSYSNTGLTASTVYTYAVSAYDAAGNTSSQSANVSATTQAQTQTNFITIKETESQSTTNYPVQLGRPFIQGEIVNYPEALVDGIAVKTQADVKSRWSDGSVKHAIVSFLIPYLPANASIQVTFRNQSLGNNNNFLTKEMMMDAIYDFDAVMELSNGGTKTVSARDMLNAGAFTYWQKGSIATTVILADHSSVRAFDTGFDAYRSVRPLFHVTFWPGIKKVKVRFIGEIANTEALQDQTYSLTLKTGYQSPKIVYTKPLFTHYSNSRWAKVFWIGGEPSRVAIDHNLAYLAETRFISNYDVRKKVSETAISDAYGQWTRAAKDIFDPGNWTQYMPEPGGRPEIGMYPTWTVRWLYTGDRRMEEQALGNADLSAAWPIHFREGKKGKKFLRDNDIVSGMGRLVSVSDRPTINLSDFSFWRTTSEDKIIPVGSRSNGNWIPDNAHQPDLVSPQYFLTGDYWYLEELYFWASWSAANTGGAAIDAPWGRGPTGAGGGIYGEVRAQAWMLKNRAHAAFVTPDDAPEKEYFTTLIHDAIAIFEGERNIQTTSFFGNANWNWGKSIKSPILGDPPLHHWHQGDLDMARQGEMDSSVTYAAVSTWNQNAMLVSLGRVKELGYPADALLSHLAFNLIGQLTHPDYNPYLVDTYRQPAKRLSDSRFFPTWGELKTGYTSEESSRTSFSRLTDPEQGYVFVALAAASMVTGEPRGIEAWQFMEKEALPASALNDNPKWALVPRDPDTSSPPDTISPTIPTNPTATIISSSQINLSWNASTDNVGVTGYKIYRCAGSACAPTTQITTSATNSYSDTGLTASTAYTYAVSAYDAAGNESEKSGAVSAATLSQFKPSDLNQDQKVDQQDFDILKQDFNRTDKPVSDLNQDGVVDSRDLGIMMSEWTR